jgi:hypothetical protein
VLVTRAPRAVQEAWPTQARPVAQEQVTQEEQVPQQAALSR